MLSGPSYRTTEWSSSFQAEWLKRSRDSRFDYSTRGVRSSQPVLHWFDRNTITTRQVIFAPGPRGLLIPKERLSEAIYDLRPILHMLMRLKHWLSGCEKSSQPSNTCIREQGNWSLSPWVKKGAVAYDGRGMRQTVFNRSRRYSRLEIAMWGLRPHPPVWRLRHRRKP